MSLGDRDIEYIRLVAREAADEAIHHMMTNGFMPALREEARQVAESHISRHATDCPVAIKVQQEMKAFESRLKLTVARGIIYILIAGGAGGLSSRLLSLIFN